MIEKPARAQFLKCTGRILYRDFLVRNDATSGLQWIQFELGSARLRTCPGLNKEQVLTAIRRGIKYLKERTPEKQFGQSESRAVQSPCKNIGFAGIRKC